MKKKLIMALLCAQVITIATACGKSKQEETEPVETVQEETMGGDIVTFEYEEKETESSTIIEEITAEMQEETMQVIDIDPTPAEPVSTEVTQEIPTGVVGADEVSINNLPAEEIHFDGVEILDGGNYYQMLDYRLLDKPEVLDMCYNLISFNNYTFIWKGQEFRLPFSLQNFIDVEGGNEQDESYVSTYDAYLRSDEESGVTYETDDYRIYLRVRNTSDEDIAFRDCSVVEVTFTARMQHSGDAAYGDLPLELHNGAKQGMNYDALSQLDLTLGGSMEMESTGGTSITGTDIIYMKDVEWVDGLGNVELGYVSYSIDRKAGTLCDLKIGYMGTYYGG